MASTTRLRLAFAPLHQSQKQQISPLSRNLQHGLRTRRAFTNSTRCLAAPKRGNTFIPQMPSMKQPSQKSFNVAMQEQKEMAQIPDDIGFLPGTFIMPTGANLPSLTTNPSGRWKLEKARLKQHAKDAIANAVMKLYYIRDSSRPSPLASLPFLSRTSSLRTWFKFPILARRSIPAVATKLYEDMYTHFARGDLDKLRPVLCENIFETLKGRVMARQPNTSLKWTLHRYLGSPKVVSHRYTPLGISSGPTTDKSKETALQQAVVRIASMQSLHRLRRVRGRDGKVTEVVDEGSQVVEGGKEVVEYFVVQRMTRKGVTGPWKVWGTTEEMTLPKIELEEKRKLGLA